MLKLIRYKNLLFIVFVQFLMSQSVIAPILEMHKLSPMTPTWVLCGIVLATVLVAAGGYVINDYFDMKIDRINRPEKVVVGTEITQKTAMIFYQILTGLGALIGFATAIYLKNFTLAFIFVVVPGMLWFYSSTYKRQLLIGNLIVALSVGLVPLLPLIVETSLLTNYYGDLIKETPIIALIYKWICGFSLFAFAWTIIREIIKDAEDRVGDAEMECRTVPIVCGEKWTKIVVISLIIIILAVLTWLVFAVIKFPIESKITQRYFIFGIVLPTICLVAMLILAKTPHDYKNAGTLTKFIMLIGTCYSLVFYFVVAKIYMLPYFNLFYIK